jgi:hypothetical protein
MFACERTMFGGLHPDVTGFWSFTKLIIHQRVEGIGLCPQLISSCYNGKEMLTEAKNDLLRCLYRACWFYKTSSDISMLMHFPLPLFNSECACQTSSPVERHPNHNQRLRFLLPPLVSCRCPVSGLALRSLLAFVACIFLASSRCAAFACRQWAVCADCT